MLSKHATKLVNDTNELRQMHGAVAHEPVVIKLPKELVYPDGVQTMVTSQDLATGEPIPTVEFYCVDCEEYKWGYEQDYLCAECRGA